ncbi:WXG100 family type VII secretion target [Streptomyces fuscigenes]|uniref:WXG100 family type VII secretion target n=1 Tax=Streptomyces fuscigenes TaxID=1528880 RepID=UPI001F1E4C91|nr:WXG100 family type VII secretion target [Streptomyces fuscigenes]MCF3963585.1 WXG100 family type VII secretion target [Streptomyces fuscigenes]
MADDKDLDVSEADLTHLVSGLSSMRDHLGDQVRRMTTLVDRIEGGWQSDAGDGYRGVHLRVAEDVVRVGKLLGVVEEAVRLSRDGFTEQESATLRRMNEEAEHVDAAAGAQQLMRAPHSRILDI